MLQKDAIPDKEPLLRVGIVLPDDQIQQIQVRLSKDIPYALSTTDLKQDKVSNMTLDFKQSANAVHLVAVGTSPYWKITPLEEVQPESKSGIMVKNIVAGRGFHWQKYLDVFLPGEIEIKCIEGNLILINQLPLEHYLMCVATSEMGAKCPAALIEAQTIVARSWMLANVEQKHIALGMDVCNDDCCQRYQGSGNLSNSSIAGAQNTAGRVLMHNNIICDARYSKSCGGVIESFATIWGGQEHAYLQALPDARHPFDHPAYPLTSEEKVRQWIDDEPYSFCSSKSIAEKKLAQYLGTVDEQGHYFRWRVVYSQSEICALLNLQLNLAAQTILDLIPLSRGGSGRIIQLKILYLDQSGKDKEIIIERDYEIRRVLHKNFLYSSCIYIEKKTTDAVLVSNFIIHGAGWGHGVGLCQIGALGMSLQGYGVKEILSHYYPGSRLVKIY